MTELSDELLVAYVDGQLARKQTLAVDKVLEQDDVIAKRVVALKHAHSRLEAAFEAILAGEEADAVAMTAPQPRGIFISWSALVQGGLATAGIAVSIALLLAGFGWPLTLPEFRSTSGAADPEVVGSIAASWQEEAARAQALLDRTSLEVGLDSQGNRDLVAFQLTQALGADLILPELGPQGFRFMRAQLLRFNDEPLAQLLYLGASGAPLALYAKKGEGTAPPLFKRYGGIGSVTWSQGGLAYLLAGEESEQSLLSLAATIGRAEPIGTKEMAPVTDVAPAPSPPPPLPKHKPKL
jgi:anti-sigma factor RsiW